MVTEIGSIQTGGGIESCPPSAAEVTFGYVKKIETITEKAPDLKCWYNGMLLPEIPADVLASYPHAWIRDNGSTGYYDLLLATGLWYCSATDTLSHNDSNNVEWYRIEKATADSSTAWTFNESKSSSVWGDDAERVCIWSNHDIPNGSATATEIYFKGSDPLTELTETVTKLVPVERESEYAVTSANINDIAKRTQEMAGTSKLLTPDDIIYFLNNVKFFLQSPATSEFALTFESTASDKLIIEEE